MSLAGWGFLCNMETYTDIIINRIIFYAFEDASNCYDRIKYSNIPWCGKSVRISKMLHHEDKFEIHCHCHSGR